MNAAEVRQVRRWLWETLATRRPPTDPPAAAGRWMGDHGSTCRELSRVLESLCEAGQLDRPTAMAWAVAAGIDGRKVTKQRLAANLGLTSIRALDGRLLKVDRLIASALVSDAPPVPIDAPSTAELLVAALTGAAAETLRGDLDAADAYRRVASEVDGTSSYQTPRRSSADRARRHRIVRRTRMALARIASRPPDIPRLQPLRNESRLVTFAYTLHDEPDGAVAELDRAWRNRSADAYPLLVDHAMRLVPNLERAGARARLHLLELVANIMRDTESVLALPVATRWLREALLAWGPANRQVVAAARTRAHILQLHGFLRSAASEFDCAIHSLSGIAFDTEHDRRMELIDLLMRRACVEVARGTGADLNLLAGHLARVSYISESADHPLPVRLQLHLMALQSDSASRRRRYEKVQEDLIRRIPMLVGAQPLAAVDTLLMCALRTRQSKAFTTELIDKLLPPLGVAHAWWNQFDRMSMRLTFAREKGISAAAPELIPTCVNLLRVEGTLPALPEFRV